MTELQQTLSAIFDLLSAIPVKGDSVEIMAAVREHLRNAYKTAGKESDNG